MASKGKKYTEETKDKLTNLLKSLPEKPKKKEYGTVDLLRGMKAEIKAALSKGYTLEEILEKFKEADGVEIGITTAKAELRQTRKQRAKI